MRSRMKKRNVTVELPEELLRQAQHASGQGITETIREGLQIISARQAYEELLQYRGKVKFRHSWQALKAGR